MPAEPVPLIGSVSWLSVRNTVRRRAIVSSSSAMNSGSMCPSSGRASAATASGYGFDGPGPEQQAIGDGHAERRTVRSRHRRSGAASPERERRVSAERRAGTSAGAAGCTSGATSSPATRPRATSAAARATCVTSTSGSVDALRGRGALHGLRRVPRRLRGLARAVRVPERAVDRDRGAPRVDLVARGVGFERPRDGADVVDREVGERGVEVVES